MAWHVGIIAALVLVLGYVLLLHWRVLRRERALAHTDGLTGVDNRRTFYEIAGREFERSRRYGHAFTLAFFDVDDFKEVNERAGPHAGDGILRLVAEATRRSIRASDVLARLGSAEFALLLPETQTAAAHAVVEKLRNALRDASRDTALPLTISGGVVTCLQPAESLEHTIGAADRLLYDAKRVGKDKFAYEVVMPQPLEGFEPARFRRAHRLPPSFDAPMPPLSGPRR